MATVFDTAVLRAPIALRGVLLETAERAGAKVINVYSAKPERGAVVTIRRQSQAEVPVKPRASAAVVSPLWRPTFEVICWHPEYAKSIELAEAVTRRLQTAEATTIQGLTMRSVVVEDSYETYEGDKYGQVLIITISYK